MTQRTTRSFGHAVLLLGTTLLLGGTAAAMSRTDDLVIRAGRVITGTGPDIENGVIVIEGGKITAIGPADAVDAPWDATVVDASDQVAAPGFVDAHTQRGMDRPNETPDVAPFLNIRDSLDPVNFFFEDCLRYGVTTVNLQHGADCVVGARGMVVRPVGLTVDEMMVLPDYGLKLSAAPKRGKSPATQAQALRLAFGDLRRYLEQLVEDDKDGNDRARREALYQGRDLEGERAKGRAMTGAGWKVEGLESIPRGEIDEKQEPLLDLVEGRIAVFFECNAPNQVALALDVARENGFLARTALVIDASCWKAADVLAEAGVPVILDGELMHIERDPLTGEEIETFAAGVLAEKGVRFALSPSNGRGAELWYLAAVAQGRGLTREQALDAVTRVPAEILGLGERVGRLESGKDGNVVLLTGDPLAVTSWVDKVVVEGRVVYDRAEDVRTLHLREGIEPPGVVSAVNELPEEPEGDEDGADEENGKDKKDDKDGAPEKDEK